MATRVVHEMEMQGTSRHRLSSSSSFPTFFRHRILQRYTCRNVHVPETTDRWLQGAGSRYYAGTKRITLHERGLQDRRCGLISWNRQAICKRKRRELLMHAALLTFSTPDIIVHALQDETLKRSSTSGYSRPFIGGYQGGLYTDPVPSPSPAPAVFQLLPICQWEMSSPEGHRVDDQGCVRLGHTEAFVPPSAPHIPPHEALDTCVTFPFLFLACSSCTFFLSAYLPTLLSQLASVVSTSFLSTLCMPPFALRVDTTRFLHRTD